MKSSALVLAGLAALAATTASRAQSVIYREIFGRSGTTSVALSNFGWSAYSGATAVNQSTSATNFSVIGETTPTNFSNVNSLPAVNSIFPGDLYTTTTNGRTIFGLSGIFLAYTSEYQIDRSAFAVNSFTWDQRNDNPALGVAVQIGGNWYASLTVPAGPGGTAWNATAASVNFETTTWFDLVFTPGTALSVGGTTTLPSGNITAFGLYAPSTRTAVTARIDGFAINATAVPEPSAFAALTGLAGLGFAAAHRRGPRSRR